jgi:hypothetical protein
MSNMKSLAAIFSLAVAAPALAAQGVKVTEAKPGLLKKAKVTAESAIATAQSRLPGATLASAEIEQEGGKLIYSLDFKTKGKPGIDEVNVDATTGRLIGEVEHESPAAEKKEAAEDSAKAAKGKAKKP